MNNPGLTPGVVLVLARSTVLDGWNGLEPAQSGPTQTISPARPKIRYFVPLKAVVSTGSGAYAEIPNGLPRSVGGDSVAS